MNVLPLLKRVLRSTKCYPVVFLLLAFQPAFGVVSEASKETVASVTSDFNAFVDAVQDLIQKKEFAKAEEIVDACIESASQKPSLPYLKNDMLYMYSSGQAEVLLFSHLHPPKTDKEKELLKKMYPWYFTLGVKPGHSISFQHPLLPCAYYFRAYIAAEKNDVLKAFQYLEKCLEVWPHYGPAYSETMFLYIRMNHYDKAKAIGEKALTHRLILNKEHNATILRHLGYIAIEENQLDKAENYYKQCLKILPDEPNALRELQYIKELREKEKNEAPE